MQERLDVNKGKTS